MHLTTLPTNPFRAGRSINAPTFVSVKHAGGRLLLGLICLVISLSCGAQDYQMQVQEMYVAYYGRPGDPGGIDYWAARLEEEGGNLDAIVDAFGNSQEFTERFGFFDDEELINNLYQQLFGRDAEPAGLTFYLEELANGQATLASIALNILDGVQDGTEDAAIVDNKLQVANRFTEAVEESDVSYTSEQIDDVNGLLSSVDASESSLTVALDIALELISEFPPF